MPFTKINSKFLEVTQKNLGDPGFGDDILDTTAKVQLKKEKIGNLDFI